VFSGTLNPTQSIIYKDQLLLTNPRDTLPHGTRNPAIAEGPRDAGVPVEIW